MNMMNYCIIISDDQGCGLGLDVSVSRRSRDVPTTNVSSRSRLGLVSVSAIYVVPKTNFRPNCASALTVLTDGHVDGAVYAV